ncbi:MAG: Holliday junction branch migration DNA helicase RuvB [Elusimicrobia bacterium HGW-Elusimicrobia-1]|jgi:Holliday junction DNA helicase RuvB|nr:MAG: Holliday junction branch migration DNA helicase RuvB [Elusimicrobia bacterium HGW-Elusimicrobia-1]
MTNGKPKKNVPSDTPAAETEILYENALRPPTLDEFVGQDALKENLRVYLAAAHKRKEPLDHCLFYSPPGLGKTTLAHIISREMGVNLRSTSGPVLARVGDLAAILSDMTEGDVLFIDEIHRLTHLVEESLYPVLEDFKLDVILGQGPSARTFRLAVPRFTLVGATTRAGLLSTPLRERFGIVGHLEYYTPEDLKAIVLRSGGILGAAIDDAAATEVASRSRGTPRIANRLLKRIRDFAEVKSEKIIGIETARMALDKMGVDSAGLDDTDRKILSALAQKFSGGPVGIESVAIAVSEDADTVSDVYEPFLIQEGYLARTPRGRVATDKAYAHLGLQIPERKNGLF